MVELTISKSLSYFGDNKQGVSTRVIDKQYENNHAQILKLAFSKAKIQDKFALTTKLQHNDPSFSTN